MKQAQKSAKTALAIERRASEQGTKTKAKPRAKARAKTLRSEIYTYGYGLPFDAFDMGGAL